MVVAAGAWPGRLPRCAATPNIILAVTPDDFVPARPPHPPHQADCRRRAEAPLAVLRHDVQQARPPPVPPEHLLKASLVAEARRRHLLAPDHFSVDGTLLEAWASLKGYRPRDGSGEPPAGGGRNAEVDFRGQQRRSETHASVTDPPRAALSQGAWPGGGAGDMGHLLTENRYGPVVDVELTEANGYAEREAALRMVERRTRGRATLGADRGYAARSPRRSSTG